jgi:hypothetical protein
MLHIKLILVILFFFQGCFLSFSPEGHTEESIASAAARWEKIPPVSGKKYSIQQCRNDMYPLIKLAKAQLGTPYKYGGMDERGFDCSGFVAFVYAKSLGKKLPHNARAQSKYVRVYDFSQLEPGDILFFDTSGRGEINHSGIYLGNGRFIHASSGKAHSVTISDLTKGFYKKAFRFGGKVKRW